jgi:aarF domain-containing kinase
MNILSRSTFATARIGDRTSSWTCSICRGQLARTATKPPPRHSIARRFASGRTWSQGKGKAHDGAKSGPNARLILFASTGAAAGTAALAFTDEIKNSYEAAERTGRVVVALAVCINE